jgi:hypothetical protein
MTAHRTLRLRREALTELTAPDLRGVVGGTYTASFEMCPTWWCTPVVGAVVETVRRVTAETTVVDCA